MTSTIQFPAHVIGLMSGTSADGVDAALLYTDGRAVVEAGASHFVPYDAALRADILALMRGAGDAKNVGAALTDIHIQAVNALIKKAAVSRETVALVGFHGQTIRHAPQEGVTVQLGEAARMAAALGIPVVADFRSNDVRHGGQGAPLVPLYHAALAHTLEKPLMVVNIGGVSNVTWLGAAGEIIAFDCGPGSALLDDWVFRHTGERYDANGALAARGVVDSALVGEFLRDPFFLRDAPKSLDRLHFETLVHGLLHRPDRQLSLEDGAATLTSMTATAIALSFGAVPASPKRVLIAGGGRHNATLMGLLKACVNAPVMAVEEVGWDGDMLEAQAFAYLAARSAQGLPLSLPTTTGVSQPVTGGVFYPA
ncbi:MAG: anhydro-N-acetylmuramic acid kinase [Alphaproteobacteria bacterium]|nr:anhydro-N-acetylmuramic acid kinase [Alphaproteobacteria bacterium]